MDTLKHQWFFCLIEKYGKSPSEQLVAVFGIVESLIQAPDIREKLAREFPGDVNCLYATHELNDFLMGLAATARMANPAGLAHQLAILLQGAIAEELRNPNTGALREAAKVAQVVVARSGKPSPLRNLGRNLGWASAGGAAAFALMLTIMGSRQAAEQVPMSISATKVALHALQVMPTGVSPDEIDAVLALHEKIETGICRAPHLLALPPGQMTAYMNVIESRMPDDPAADERNLRQFLAWFDTIKSTECYYPPFNGHTNVKWTKS